MKRIVSYLLSLLVIMLFPITAKAAEIKGTVTKENFANYVDVALTHVPLSSKLRKQYQGYEYTITNNTGQSFNILNAQITNGTNGSVAYQAVDDGHPIGITWAICGPVGLFTFGIGWAVGLVATPVVWIVSSSGKNRARVESMAYNNLVNLGQIASNESLQVKTLIPIGTTPQLKLTVQPQNFADIITINK